ncbi:hypothetical protein ASG41_19245 [Modestobacter sp. Leaf380]|nr:hypothetical protein ASG41_19245 [Modestobacter sp. Leaf380]
MRAPGDQLGWRVTGVLATTAWAGCWGALLLRLVRARRTGRGPGTRALLALAAGSAAPFLTGGPVGSLDVNSYAAVGRLAHLGLDPYRVFPIALDDAFGAAVDPLWRQTPTPYGPLQVALFRGVAELAGTDQRLAVLLVRAVAVLALVAAVALVVRVADPRDRALAVALTAANPLVVVHVVAGAHVDVLIGLGAVAVVLLAGRGWVTTAMAVAVLLAFVKLPGAVLAGYVLLRVVRTRGPVVPTVVSALLTTGLVLVLLPHPLGWVEALGVPGQVRNGTAPSTWLAYGLAEVVPPLGLDGALGAARLVVAVVGVVLATLVLWRAAGAGTRQATGLVGVALVLVALSGPALYPWYLAWGALAVAAGGSTRARWALVALSAYLTLAGTLTEGPVAQLVCAAAAAALAAGAVRYTRPGVPAAVRA